MDGYGWENTRPLRGILNCMFWPVPATSPTLPIFAPLTADKLLWWWYRPFPSPSLHTAEAFDVVSWSAALNLLLLFSLLVTAACVRSTAVQSVTMTYELQTTRWLSVCHKEPLDKDGASLALHWSEWFVMWPTWPARPASTEWHPCWRLTCSCGRLSDLDSLWHVLSLHPADRWRLSKLT